MSIIGPVRRPESPKNPKTIDWYRVVGGIERYDSRPDEDLTYGNSTTFKVKDSGGNDVTMSATGSRILDSYVIKAGRQTYEITRWATPDGIRLVFTGGPCQERIS